MIDFRSDVVAGVVLVRSAIQSPNYVAGVSGWTINQDGSAEFNDVDVRGELMVIGDNGSYLLAESDFGIPKLFFRTQNDGVLDANKLAAQIYATNGADYMNLGIFSPVYAVGLADNQAVLILQSANADGSQAPSIFMGANNLALPKLTVEINGFVQINETLNVDGLMTGGVPWCRVAKTAVQTLTTGAITALTFTSETADDLGWHSNVTNPSRITPTLPGRYLVIGNITFAANATGDRRGYILKNGATNGNWTRVFPSGAVQTETTVMGIVEVNGTTDYIEVAGLQSSGGNLDVAGAGDVTFSCTAEVIYQGSAP